MPTCIRTTFERFWNNIVTGRFEEPAQLDDTIIPFLERQTTCGAQCSRLFWGVVSAAALMLIGYVFAHLFHLV